MHQLQLAAFPLIAACAGYLHHQLVRYSSTFNKGSFPKRMSSTPDGRVVINPRGNDIQVRPG